MNFNESKPDIPSPEASAGEVQGSVPSKPMKPGHKEPVLQEDFDRYKGLINWFEALIGQAMSEKELAPLDGYDIASNVIDLNAVDTDSVDPDDLKGASARYNTHGVRGKYLSDLTEAWLAQRVSSRVVGNMKLPIAQSSNSDPPDPDSSNIVFVIPIAAFPPLPKKNVDPFYERFIWSLIFALQHPHGIKGMNDEFDPELSLRYFASAIAAHRKFTHSYQKNPKPLFKTFCIVWIAQPDFTLVMYGHTAWCLSIVRKPEGDEKYWERVLRQCFMGIKPLAPEELVSDTQTDIEQCAEHIALPIAFRAAKQFIKEKEGDKITIFALALNYQKDLQGGEYDTLRKIAFCSNCIQNAENLVNGPDSTGIRIIDTCATSGPAVYQSPKTAELFNI